ncbi:MAG TPA: hypothetical protein VHD81_09225 [Mycobacteriales bacterium]|nr:hypothetical protein [Mycobacteriales bacterium]
MRKTKTTIKNIVQLTRPTGPKVVGVFRHLVFTVGGAGALAAVWCVPAMIERSAGAPGSAAVEAGVLPLGR